MSFFEERRMHFLAIESEKDGGVFEILGKGTKEIL